MNHLALAEACAWWLEELAPELAKDYRTGKITEKQLTSIRAKYLALRETADILQPVKKRK